MSKTPLIGIVPSFDEGEQFATGPRGIRRVFLRRDYLESIARVGSIPLQLSPEMTFEQIIELCDGIIISGGQDIDPKRYGEEHLPQLRQTESAERFDWEARLIEACDDVNMPILGICYGLQRLNIYYGGSLIQDIPTELAGEAIDHDNTTHSVTFIDNFLGIKSGARRSVASRHHQAIARIGDGVHVCAVAPDGIIEAAKFGENHFGMQWHPESDETGVHMYRAFVEHCMAKRTA